VDPTIRLPGHMLEHAWGFMDGTKEPAPAKDASTVVLLRRGADALELYLLRRHTDMAFAGGFCVFPGGGVDERDYNEEIDWVGPSVAEWAKALDTDEPHARALVCAAVRETFEESGVLLAGPDEYTIVADTTAEDWERDRQRLEGREVSLTEFLRERGLKLRTDLLRLWGSWVTPVFEPKRYDTRFFVAELPAGQVTRDVSTESDAVVWMPVREAVRAAGAKELFMLPPTFATCMEMWDFEHPSDALAAAVHNDLTPIRPTAKREGDQVILELPQRLVDLGRRIAAAAGS
jgi:8-oxo-dGTP pyrophosphatase MutT (NUDIX family)